MKPPMPYFGGTFGRLEVVNVLKVGRRLRAVCRCACGTTKEVALDNCRWATWSEQAQNRRPRSEWKLA